MEINHHHRKFELDDAWWVEAGMENFAPKRRAYRVDKEKAEGKEILEIRIDDISPKIRKPGVPAFNVCPKTGKTARARTVEILQGFAGDAAMEPVKVYPESSDSEFPYELKDGTHRLYCSLAAGFTHIPAIKFKKFDYGTRS